MSDCLFCKIVAGEIPSKPVAQSERAYAFYDIAPQAPVHVLVIPKEHITSADEVASEPRRHRRRPGPAGPGVVELEGVRESGYRLVLNVGRRRSDDRAAPAPARARRTANGVAPRMTFDATAHEALHGDHLRTEHPPDVAGCSGRATSTCASSSAPSPSPRSASRATRSRSTGPDAAKVLRLFDELVLVLEGGQSLDAAKISRTIDMVDDDLRPSEVLRHEVVRGAKGKPIRPSTAGQKRYTDAIDVVDHHLRHRPGRHRQELPRRRRRRSRPCTAARSSASC